MSRKPGGWGQWFRVKLSHAEAQSLYKLCDERNVSPESLLRVAFINYTGQSTQETRVTHAVTCKMFPDPHDEREPKGPCTCGVGAPDRMPHDMTCPQREPLEPWRCTICQNVNPDDATHCRQCEYSRLVLRDGRPVLRNGQR